MNDKTVFWWESYKPTLIRILTPRAMVSSGVQDQHLHTECGALLEMTTCFQSSVFTFGRWWILVQMYSTVETTMSRMIYRVSISTVNAYLAI